VHELLGQGTDGPAAADHIVQDDGRPLPGEVADDVQDPHGLRFRPVLGGNRTVDVKGTRKPGHESGGPCVGRDRNDIWPVAESIELLDEQAQRLEHVDRRGAVESPDVGPVARPGDEPVDPGREAEIRDEAGRDGLSPELRGLVLPAVREVRKDPGHMVGPVFAKSPRCDQVGHEVLIHTPPACGVIGRLEQERVASGDVAIQTNTGLGVRKVLVHGLELDEAFRAVQQGPAPLADHPRQIDPGPAARDQKRSSIRLLRAPCRIRPPQRLPEPKPVPTDAIHRVACPERVL